MDHAELAVAFVREALLDAWLSMLSYCDAGPVDQKAFRTLQGHFNLLYKRADYAAQGAYHYALAAWYKEQGL